MPCQHVLQGLRILIVEDNFLIAEEVRELFAASGSIIVGPASRVPEGLQLAIGAELDGAVLDINLAGEFCFPIAAALSKRRVPYIFLSGYPEEATLLPLAFLNVPRLVKPFEGPEITQLAAEYFTPTIRFQR